MDIVLPYFRSPRRRIKIAGLLFSPITNPLDDPGFEEREEVCWSPLYQDDWNLGAYEYAKLATTKNSHRCVLLQVPDEPLHRVCYRAIVDLVTAHWRYALWRTERFAHGRRANEDWVSIPRYRLTRAFLDRCVAGYKLARSNRRFEVALHRWESSYLRDSELDTVLDCCSALEALFAMGDELRLRLSLATFFSVRRRRLGFAKTYEMYGIRNSFIHGAKAIPQVSPKDRRTYVGIVAEVLGACIAQASIPDQATLNTAILKYFS